MYPTNEIRRIVRTGASTPDGRELVPFQLWRGLDRKDYEWREIPEAEIVGETIGRSDKMPEVPGGDKPLDRGVQDVPV